MLMKMHTVGKLAGYLEQARAVKVAHSVSVFRQFTEIAKLRRGRGYIGPGDYYTYRLFEPIMSVEEKYHFAGWRAEAELDSLNDPQWRCLGLDKVLMYALLQSSDIRIPETRAIYLAGRNRSLAGATCLTSESDLNAWLREPTHYPFFSKPSASGFGRDTFFALNLDTTTDCIVLQDGNRVPVMNFGRGLHDVEHLGYLFQKPVLPDERLVAAMGNTPSSLRLMILLDETEGPLLHRAFWKIPTGRNMTDNFNAGKTGNLAAAINHESGRVTRVITGIGMDLTEADYHPDTGVRFKDLVVPDWHQVKEFACEAALTLPKLRFQQWDIALSSEGPLALEVNLFATGGCDLTQLLYRKGLLDGTMQRFLDRHANRLRLKAP